MKVVCISDTHMSHWELAMPYGDILVVAGDISGMTTDEELYAFNEWLGTLDYKAIFVIPGNHDGQFVERETTARSLLTNATVLIDEMVEFQGYKIYGSPWVAQYGDWWYMIHRDALADKWKKIPDGVDILLTHQPPYMILDKVNRGNAGCMYLRDEVLTRIKPQLHVFGHLHWCGGQYQLLGQTTFVNAAMNDEMYYCNREPVVIDVYPRPKPETTEENK